MEPLGRPGWREPEAWAAPATAELAVDSWWSNHKLRTPSNEGECHNEWQSFLVVWQRAGLPIQSGQIRWVSLDGFPMSLQYWHRLLDDENTLPCRTRQSEHEGRPGWMSAVVCRPYSSIICNTNSSRKSFSDIGRQPDNRAKWLYKTKALTMAISIIW